MMVAFAGSGYALALVEYLELAQTPQAAFMILAGAYAMLFCVLFFGFASALSRNGAQDYRDPTQAWLKASPSGFKVAAAAAFLSSLAILSTFPGGSVEIADWAGALPSERAALYAGISSFWVVPLPWVVGYSRSAA